MMLFSKAIEDETFSEVKRKISVKPRFLIEFFCYKC